MDLAHLKKVSLQDLHNFLVQDHTSFTVLSASLKYILSTNRLTVSLTKNSAKCFYRQPKTTDPTKTTERPDPHDDCLHDAQNCSFFQFFNRKEKRLYLRFLDKCEANFQGLNQAQLLFLTLTFNTTHDNLATFTTNWNPTDPCWKPLTTKKPWLLNWAQDFDPACEPLKIILQKVSPADAADFNRANAYVTKFLRDIRLKWKPQNWKWVIVTELQKRGVWHFHLITTPLTPYAHRCNLDQHFKPCFNCRTYLSKLWPWGRVESRSPSKKSISKYLAKYLAKSFHLRKLYQEHGFHSHNKAYRFFKNLYAYEERAAIMLGKSKIDKLSGKYLNGNQHLFKRSDNAFYYRSNERLIASAEKPYTEQKHYRLGTRSLNPLPLLNLAKKSTKKEAILLTKPKQKQLLDHEFQQFLITQLLLRCKKAEFVHVPLEQEQVPKDANQCDNNVYSHFQTKQVLNFTFKPDKALEVRLFFSQLDDYANQYDMGENKDFLDQRFLDPVASRNQYLNNWQLNISDYQPTNYYA